MQASSFQALAVLELWAGSDSAKFALDRYLCVISESQVFGLRAGSGLAKMASNGRAVLGITIFL